MTFPDDENGDVLRRMEEDGDDLSKPRDIDFNHVFDAEEDARRFAEAATRVSYLRLACQFEEETNAWGVLVKVFMIPTHERITGEEIKLDSLAREYGGRADGWGCMQVE